MGPRGTLHSPCGQVVEMYRLRRPLQLGRLATEWKVAFHRLPFSTLGTGYIVSQALVPCLDLSGNLPASHQISLEQHPDFDLLRPPFGFLSQRRVCKLPVRISSAYRVFETHLLQSLFCGK